MFNFENNYDYTATVCLLDTLIEIYVTSQKVNLKENNNYIYYVLEYCKFNFYL